jgi:hypothetical protein
MSSELNNINSRSVRGAIRRDDTIVRYGGDAYVAALTWTADDRQLLAVVDSPKHPQFGKDGRAAGFAETDRDFFESRVFAIAGNPDNATFHEVSRYPDIPNFTLQGTPDDPYYSWNVPYYGLNALAVDEHFYQFLSTENSFRDKDGNYDFQSGGGFTHAKLITSTDNGRTWCNQNGTTPVTIEPREKQSRENMAFYREPQQAFSQLTFLQMGRAYQDNRDGYLYVYGPNGITEGSMNQLVMFRVPTRRLLERQAYEYFAGMGGDGEARWSKEIDAREVVHTFPSGLVPIAWPLSWLPSIAYNNALGIYMMAACSGIPSTCVVSNPTYFGVWVSRCPWGPWRQIHEEKTWTPGGDAASRATSPVIAPKWIAPNGRSFWLVWTDVQNATDEDVLASLLEKQRSYAGWIETRERWGKAHPYFGFNTQRVDLLF